MLYCPKCKKLYNDGTERCTCKNKKLKPVTHKNTPVTVCEVSGVDRERVRAALEDAAIPSYEIKKKSISYEPITGGDIADVYVVVPYQAYEKAYDICVGIGVINPDDNSVETEEVLKDINSKKSDFDKNADDFMEMSSSKRTLVRIVSGVLLIAVFCVFIWGVDYLIELIKGLL
ncbi:MAG: hypothetical protein J1F17_02785 [Oscillospiraceae bacterium]|nr:hypothetical protein [Oscillospiraceae bacterium]